MLRLPVTGPIPRFVYPGDILEVHALWVQQPPLASITVPAFDSLASPTGGDAGASIAESELSSSPLPPSDLYVRGQPIAHRFLLSDEVRDSGGNRAVFSYTLMRLHETRAPEFVRFAHISYDAETGIYSFSIDTSMLVVGRYRLLIGSADGEMSYRMDLSIVEANL
jgi:hypothetical protein